MTEIVYFCPDKWEPLQIEGIDVEYRTWDDVIMYKYFYPLLEKISHKTLIVCDEMMRVKKRNDLTYNCLHHYGNQTDKIIVFEYFPIIDEPDDFMILVDLAYPNRYKGMHFTDGLLPLAEITPRAIDITARYVDVSDDTRTAYGAERDRLFDELGNKDPNTIPRNLHIWVGTKTKKPAIGDGMYVARNSRFKKGVFVYKNAPAAERYNILDFPVRSLEFNDFLKRTGAEHITFIHSGLSVDKVFFGEYAERFKMIQEVFYADTSISE